MNLLEACLKTRQITASTLESTLREVLAASGPISEIALRDLWLSKLREHESLYPDGWYMPPPHGMFVQFATDTDPARVNNVSNRPPETWPRADVFLDRTRGIISAYASPVDRATGMIGDMCVMLYFGSNTDIQAHLAAALQLDYDVFEQLRAGMKLSEVADLTYQLLAARGYVNTVASPNDPTGTNIGHALPASDTGWSAEERAIFEKGDWNATKDMISRKRLFLNTSEHTRIPPNFAHTIEPRPELPNRPDLPASPYHTIVIWRDGHKQLITGFDGLFRLAGMDYMLAVGPGSNT